MAVITNFDKLKDLHAKARLSKVGSREWIEFASTMMDSFPVLYETAKNVNREFAKMKTEIEQLKLMKVVREFEIIAEKCRELHREVAKGEKAELHAEGRGHKIKDKKRQGNAMP